MSATKKTLYLTRHAQAEHNVAEDYSIPDAPLTKLGRSQSAELNKVTASNIQKTADLLVSSPLARTLQTTVIGYPVLRERLESLDPPKPLIVLSRLQVGPMTRQSRNVARSWNTTDGTTQ